MARGDCLLDANFCGRAVGHNDLVTAVVGAQSPAYTTCSFPKKSPKKSHLLGYFKIIFPFLIWHNQQKQRWYPCPYSLLACGTMRYAHNHLQPRLSIQLNYCRRKNLWETSSRIANFVQCSSLYVFSSNENDANVEHTHSIDFAQMWLAGHKTWPSPDAKEFLTNPLDICHYHRNLPHGAFFRATCPRPFGVCFVQPTAWWFEWAAVDHGRRSRISHAKPFLFMEPLKICE